MDCDLNFFAGKKMKNGKLCIQKMKIDFKTGKIGLKFGPETKMSRKSNKHKYSSQRINKYKLKSKMNYSQLDKSKIYNQESQYSEMQSLMNSSPKGEYGQHQSHNAF